MKRLWPGWLLCMLTAGLFIYMGVEQGREFSALVGKMKIPDAMFPAGYDLPGARLLFDRLVADVPIAAEQARQSASELYVAIHAGTDLLFPPMMALSLAFLGFAAIRSHRADGRLPRLAGVGLGLVLALAFAYLVTDFTENAVADTVFGPAALKVGLNEELVFVLRVVTASKFVTFYSAIALTAGLWFWHWKNRAKPATQPTET